MRPVYYIKVTFAGRSGSQADTRTNKRQAIRVCRDLVGQGELGTVGSVRDSESDLVYQCSRAKHRDGKLYTRVDEL